MSKKGISRSIIANFGALTSSLPSEGEPAQVPAPSARSAPRVNAGIIGATQRSLTEIREERDRLQELVAKGAWHELDPNLIDPSPFPDRLPDESDGSFDDFLKGFREEGQKVPIQVRPHPTVTGRYQVVFGHRRWRAARESGVAVKASIVELTDRELALAQGIENSARQDLSWIERALFAEQMSRADIKPRDIKAALSVDDAEMTRFRQVAKVIPVDIIRQIGRAPKAGRPRWSVLADAFGRGSSVAKKVEAALAADKGSSSDARFRLALAAASEVRAREDQPREVELRTTSGTFLGKVAFGDGVRFSLSGKAGDFMKFLREELPGLMERYSSRHEAQPATPTNQNLGT
jgi:ParB family transcriptional regulator, chromosome partitioning protein